MSQVKNKMSIFGLITSIATIVLTVLSFVAMAFNFYVAKAGSLKESGTMKDWIDVIGIDMDGIGWWKTSRVFMIITLVVVAILAVLVLVKFFYKHKVLNLVLFVGGIVVLVLAIIFLITFCVGCGELSNEYAKIVAGAGPIILAICAILASVGAGLNGYKK